MKLKFLSNLLEYTIFSLSILLVFMVLFEKYLVVPMLFRWIGHWHPLILHFPIVLIFVTILQYWRKDKYVYWYLGVTALFALISSLSGFLLSTENVIKGNQILAHQWAGIGVSALLVSWWHFYKSLDNRVFLMRGIHSVMIVLIIFTGHVGGSITHGENFLSFQPDKAEEPVVVDNPNIYSSFVQPIFTDKCTQCHNADKSKGKLILSDYLSLAAGGESGPGLDFSDLEKSLLKHHLELPNEDEDHMPPSDEEQLTEGELMILNDWLSGGASDTLTMLGLKADSRLYTYIQNKQNSDDLGRFNHLPEVTDEKLQKLSSNYIAITRLHHGTDAVSVTVFANTTYDPSQLKSLAAISKNIVLLDLSSIAIEDQEIAFIKSCLNLEKLNLSNTALEDEALQNIGIIANLRTLNLFNTSITDASVAGLTAFPKLSELFVYGSEITDDGVVKLSKSHEKLTVFTENTQAKEFSSVLPPASISPLKYLF
ncbi:MAG: c-type cytochrome domain-containing protein [Cyclobacteriaceae bacterium]|nr:c-type cytochrome domain-containing protein [Cyclobacteriaceae bacterium]